MFEWDEAKREANLAKHGVDFVDAIAVFADPFRLERSDERHDYGEERRQTIGAVRDPRAVYRLHSTEHRTTPDLSTKGTQR